jgi:iron uptake system EfeUOB component EfeO/EfeM
MIGSVSVFARTGLMAAVAGLTLAFNVPQAAAQYATVELAVKDKTFDPVELKAPANTRVVIHITNHDAKAMEFESKELKAEKVVAANGEGIVRVGPLKPGRYEFFDDFNQANRGTLVVQ